MAATHGASSVIDLLLEYGADLTSKNNANESALDVAKKSLESANDSETKARLTKCVELLEEKWRKLEAESQALADLLLEDEKKSDKKGNNNTKNINTSDNKKKNQKKNNKPNVASEAHKTIAAKELTTQTKLDPAKHTAHVQTPRPEQPTKVPANKINTNVSNTQPELATTNTTTSTTMQTNPPKSASTFSYASVVSKNLPPRAAVFDTPPVTPSKLNPNNGVTPKRAVRQRQYDANNDDDALELVRKAQAYDLLQQSLESMHVQTAQLGLECEHMFGLNLSSLSMSQLTALEELHFDALKQLSEAKVDFVRDLEQIRQEERLALERTIMLLTKQLNENNE